MRRIEFEWLEKFDPVNPGTVALNVLEPYRKRRVAAAAKLCKVYSPLGEFCAWCNVREIPSHLKKYCSPACRRSAYMYVAPQDPALKIWILIHRQACACAICKEDFEDQLASLINRKASHAMRTTGIKTQVDSVSYFTVGYDTGSIWHVDHIRPIHMGGDGIGFENIQILCVKCHKKKTATEAAMIERKNVSPRASDRPASDKPTQRQGALVKAPERNSTLGQPDPRKNHR